VNETSPLHSIKHWSSLPLWCTETLSTWHSQCYQSWWSQSWDLPSK